MDFRGIVRPKKALDCAGSNLDLHALISLEMLKLQNQQNYSFRADLLAFSHDATILTYRILNAW